MKCFSCSKKAKWVRVTQFAGKHFYCKEHAHYQSDFKKEKSTFYWIKVKDMK